MRQLLLLAITIFVVVSLTACDQQNNSKRKKAKGNLVMVSSVSSDGKYAITTNMNEQAYLWDLENHSYKPLSKVPVNIYSAYFIKNSHNFIYQLNSTNEVIVQNISGEVVKKLNPGFPTYGQVMSKNLSTWVGVDEFDQIFIESKNGNKQLMYHYCGPNYKDEVPPPPGAPYTCGSFMGDGKLFNLALSPSEETLFLTGFGESYVWEIQNTIKLKKLDRSVAQTVNTISPDGKYALIVDLGGLMFKYNIDSKIHFPFFIRTNESLDSVKEYYQNNFTHGPIAIKFIDNKNFLAMYHGVPDPLLQLGLYNIDDMQESDEFWTKYYLKPKKYLALTDSSKNFNSPNAIYPETKSFVRDQSMDTSPSAHVLVMGQANGGGIMVYRYDPKAQELKLDWAPRLPSKSN